MKYEQPVLSIVSNAAALILGGGTGADDSPMFPPTKNPGAIGLDD